MPPNNGIEYFNMTSDHSRELLEGSTQTEESGTMTSFSDFDGIQIDSNDETEGVIERISRLFSTVRVSYNFQRGLSDNWPAHAAQRDTHALKPLQTRLVLDPLCGNSL